MASKAAKVRRSTAHRRIAPPPPPPPPPPKRSMVGTLSEDVIVEVPAQIAARSPAPVDDLCSLRATCKALYAASKDRFVGRRIAVENVKLWRDPERHVAIITHCADAGNVDASYIVGMWLIFQNRIRNIESGMSYLERASNAGHKKAAYVLGVLLYTDDGMRATGMRHFNRVEDEEEIDHAGDPGRKIRRSNDQCRQCRWSAVQFAAWQNPKLQGVVAPPRLRGCTVAGCSAAVGWENRMWFCSDACRIGYECLMFFTQIDCLPV